MTTDEAFQVMDWRVDPSTCRISRGVRSIKLEPKVMELLVYLASQPGQVLSREELEDHVWAGMVVGYDALTHAIIKLRKAFEDDPKHPRFIQTVPKKGYRLVAEVTNASDQAGAHDFERKLTTILAADVVGYSRHMGIDEIGTLTALKTHQNELIEPKAVQYHGRTIKLMGDGTLMEFSSVVDAVRFAIEVQAAMQQYNEGVPDDRQIVYRIGINASDIIVDDDDIYGDGVNIAARLQGLAEPGGICVARNVVDQVGNKLDVKFENLGELEVKNITKPVSAYRVVMGKKVSGLARSAQTLPRWVWGRPAIVTPLVVLIAVMSGLAWWQTQQSETDRTADKTNIPALPDKPSIAVLPFNNMSDDQTQEYFSDGITEDIITDLSKITGLFVIARNSSFQYKRTSVEIKEIAKELGVRYVLEGSVRKAQDQVRINAQLIDTATGGHMWADRYDGRLENIFELQDNVTRKIITALAVQLTAGEQEQVARKETESSEAYDAFLRGWEHYLQQTPEDFSEAVSHFENAIKLDSQYARAYAALAATYWEVWKRFWHKSLGLPHGSHEPRYRAEQLLAKAMRNPTPLAHQVASAMLIHQQQHEEAIAEAQRAIALDPNDADSYIALAATLSLAGNADEALEWVERAMRLNPHYPAYYLYQLGLARFAMGEFAQAAISLEKATALNPDDRWSHRLLIATYGSLNRTEDATRILEALKQRDKRGWLNAIDPITIRTSAFWLPFNETKDAERLAQGLRNAGVAD